MISAQKPEHERERISALYEYDLLDTLTEKEYDDITRIAADICETPISTITLVDRSRQWFKSRVGLAAPETPREMAFCAHAILFPENLFMVPDAAKDERFFDNPLVTGEPNIAFYAGVPLVNESGNALGTLCVIDSKPRTLSTEQVETMRALARQVMANFEVRKKNKQLARQKLEIEKANADLTRFAHVVAHDMKSPYNSMVMSLMYLKDAYGKNFDHDGLMLLDMVEANTRTAIGMVDGILQHALQSGNVDVHKENFLLGNLANSVQQLLDIPTGFTVKVTNESLPIFASKTPLIQILLNLCSNAIKYNDKGAEGWVQLTATDDGEYYCFQVADNGPGISLADQACVFDLFTTLGVSDRYHKRGTGIGLSTAQRLVQRLEGTIRIDSEPGNGCSFIFTVRK